MCTATGGCNQNNYLRTQQKIVWCRDIAICTKGQVPWVKILTWKMFSSLVLGQFFAKKIENWNFSYDFEKNKCEHHWMFSFYEQKLDQAPRSLFQVSILSQGAWPLGFSTYLVVTLIIVFKKYNFIFNSRRVFFNPNFQFHDQIFCGERYGRKTTYIFCSPKYE